MVHIITKGFVVIKEYIIFMVYSFFIKNVFEKGIDFIFGVMGKIGYVDFKGED